MAEILMARAQRLWPRLWKVELLIWRRGVDNFDWQGHAVLVIQQHEGDSRRADFRVGFSGIERHVVVSGHRVSEPERSTKTKKMRISSKEARERGYDPVSVACIERAEAGQREADALRQRIDETFTSIPKPSTTLRVARALDDEWWITEERAAELALEDPETDWRDVPKAKTEAYQEYFTFSDPPGWRFYLPAFMSHYLTEFPDYGYDSVYWACCRREHIGELTEEELAVVDKFLELCHRYERL